jgi:hypothetical protein
MKKKRIVDKALTDFIKTLPCMACGRTSNIHAHHVTTRGAGGHDTPENLSPLCATHHTEIHKIGVVKFFTKYPMFKTWLQKAERFDVLEKEKKSATK